MSRPQSTGITRGDLRVNILSMRIEIARDEHKTVALLPHTHLLYPSRQVTPRFF